METLDQVVVTETNENAVDKKVTVKVPNKAPSKQLTLQLMTYWISLTCFQLGLRAD